MHKGSTQRLMDYSFENSDLRHQTSDLRLVEWGFEPAQR